MHRIASLAAAAIVALSSPAHAQQQAVPPAAPTIGASGGIGAGIAMPIARAADGHAAGYTVSGLVDFSAADQPFSFRFEGIYQRYDRKGTAPAGTENLNITSVGASLLARSPQKGASTFVLGGIAVYHMSDHLGTKPGVNAGIGIEVPLTQFIGMADIRVHYVLTDGKPIMTIPVTLGVRF